MTDREDGRPRRGRPLGTTAISGDRFRRRYAEVVSEIIGQGYEPSDKEIAAAIGVHPKTLHTYRRTFGVPRGSTG